MPDEPARCQCQRGASSATASSPTWDEFAASDGGMPARVGSATGEAVDGDDLAERWRFDFDSDLIDETRGRSVENRPAFVWAEPGVVSDAGVEGMPVLVYLRVQLGRKRSGQETTWSPHGVYLETVDAELRQKSNCVPR